MRALQESLDSDTLIITMKQIKQRKNTHQEVETLLALQGKNNELLFGVKLDRASKRSGYTKLYCCNYLTTYTV